ncbi:hypothetical protein JMJ77_0003770 [Colletotrichum scovillei]|uniref:Uncharacterized protein n=1 Tax=Colletotrichum scovillei TaxID=1209932 RepID=A0A9P7UDP9_9PEZI|nr:hypothetical protein JMJ77_0003770 [Colletotrichum scovillei]KAG7049017.1 hypothetical protein JMJ78_0013001 [Colletotrichum scovillei]KAG7063760.1 hypothetical protein JMJ76_0006809 [Colletotrichum scovillei]
MARTFPQSALPTFKLVRSLLIGLLSTQSINQQLGPRHLSTTFRVSTVPPAIIPSRSNKLKHPLTTSAIRKRYGGIMPSLLPSHSDLIIQVMAAKRWPLLGRGVPSQKPVQYGQGSGSLTIPARDSYHLPSEIQTMRRKTTAKSTFEPY